jgi:hypothetical protein
MIAQPLDLGTVIIVAAARLGTALRALAARGSGPRSGLAERGSGCPFRLGGRGGDLATDLGLRRAVGIGAAAARRGFLVGGRALDPDRARRRLGLGARAALGAATTTAARGRRSSPRPPRPP